MRDHPVIEQMERMGYPNAVVQPEHSGTDYFGDEILEGDDIVIDGEEMVLKDNLEDYLSDVYGLEFTTAK
ncbi:hypothetical protein LC048_21105 [Mesobacillus subterraneus]|uniref:YqaI family protein n=1 Tax=Mesobacillus subterraneus TaxID=285983 RepID=UPI001CFE6C7D|nr:hypothetical protein [Mesobacillus subterraneus]WLR54864.1 hypothetical protein LC048_21105 [Mesobacillus subterraneus]